MFTVLHNLTLALRLTSQALAYFASGRWRRARSMPREACQVPSDFFGLGVANAPESASDDYIMARLNELGVSHVRLDFTYGDRDAFTERFLNNLLKNKFRVCLHLLQPREDAQNMTSNAETVERWRAFVSDMLDQYGKRVELIEIGATCNRRKWSGYSPAAFLIAWQAAWEEARGRNLKIAGPNVTDFEPLYNAGWLGEMRRAGLLPGIHTDNLFVERATEPETFDHKIAGRRLSGILRFNLVRKAQLLQDIGAWAGVPTLVCAHVTWSLRRIARFLEDVEEKQADYLARYACLAAASGALSRVYWGTLIGQRDGLIDDGTSEYPEIPNVTYYEQARGHVGDYRLRPAFLTFRHVIRLLSGAAFRRCLVTGHGLEILEFVRMQKPGAGGQEKEDGKHKTEVLHAAWTTNGNCASAADCYPPDLLASAAVYSRDGRRLERVPRMFCESPVFMVWPIQTPDARRQTPESNNQNPKSGVRCLIPGFRFARKPGWDFDLIRESAETAGLTGVYLAGDNGAIPDIRALVELCLAGPRSQGEREKARIMRAARNLVWSVPAHGNSKRAIVIKAFRRRSILRRMLDRGKPDKAVRSWNGAQELLRRGILSPTPLACLTGAHAKMHPAGYYICEAFTPAWSVRDVFNAFSAGATEFHGYSTNDWYAAIAVFLQKLHTRGVYFRDLSAGNLLVRPESEPMLKPAPGPVENNPPDKAAFQTKSPLQPDTAIPRAEADQAAQDRPLEFALIDTARARFYPHSLNLRLRLCDLMRLCHPLSWSGRRFFVEKYLAHNGRRFNWWLKIPFWYYDGKHWLKNTLKRRKGPG